MRLSGVRHVPRDLGQKGLFPVPLLVLVNKLVALGAFINVAFASGLPDLAAELAFDYVAFPFLHGNSIALVYKNVPADGHSLFKAHSEHFGFLASHTFLP